MSRIYDALQRADMERRSTQESESAGAAEPDFLSGSAQMPAIHPGIVLDQITRYPWHPSALALPTLGDRGESIEQFRALRSQIYQQGSQASLKTILVSSGMPAEGKTFVAANLAMSLARNQDNTVLLIDADLRFPALHAILGAPNLPGLSEFLAGTAQVNDILQRSQSSQFIESGIVREIPNLTFIPAGAGGDSSSELVTNHRIEELIELLSPHFDWIVIDSPPVLAFADAIDLARAADAVLLVARGGVTSFEVAQRSQTAFSNSRILGFVLNAVRETPRNDSYYYYYQKEEAGSGLHGHKNMGRKG